MLAAEDDAETTLDDDKEARAIPERDRQAEHDEDERRVFDAIREGCHRRRGYAIVLAHPDRAALAVLEREVPKLRRSGVRFERVSTLLKPQAY